MARARKVCPHPGCPNVMGACETHDRKPWASSNRRAELPRGWSNRIVPFILERDPVCTDGRVCQGMALSTEVHHRFDRDDHRLGSLGGVCAECHKAATAEQSRAARVA